MTGVSSCLCVSFGVDPRNILVTIFGFSFLSMYKIFVVWMSTEELFLFPSVFWYFTVEIFDLLFFFGVVGS